MNKQYIDQGKEFPFFFTCGQMNFDSQTYTFPMSQNLQLDVRVKRYFKFDGSKCSRRKLKGIFFTM